MTIRSVRIYYHPRRKRLERYLAATHWAFAEWFPRRLSSIRAQLGGPEAKGVDLVNFMLYEDPTRAWHPNEWHRRGNTFEFSFVCNLSPLRDFAPLENVAKLMQFTGAMTADAPWPQVRALGAILAAPLSDDEKTSLRPYLTWPRESFYRNLGYDGERLEAAMDTARLEAKEFFREARYQTPTE